MSALPKPPADHDAVVIDQLDKRFVPRVSVVRTGTAITFPNSDRIRHQVYSFSAAKTFSLKLYAGAPQTPVISFHAAPRSGNSAPSSQTPACMPFRTLKK